MMVPKAIAKEKTLKGAITHSYFWQMEGVTCPVFDTANLDAFLMEYEKGENFYVFLMESEKGGEFWVEHKFDK